MKQLLHIIGICALVWLVVSLDFFNSSFHIFPLYYINIIFLAGMLSATFSNNPYFLGISSLAMFIKDIFSTFPFGINTLLITFSLILSHWMLHRIFTNRSPGIVGLSSFVGMIAYKGGLIVVIYILYLFFHFPSLINESFLHNAVMDIIFTSIASVIAYFCLKQGIKSFYPYRLTRKKI